MNDTRQARTFIATMVLAGASAAAYAGYHNSSMHFWFSVTVLALSVATSRMKAKLPGIDGTMSVNLPFLLTAIVNLSALEVVAITFASTLAQCWPKKGKAFKAEQMTFNLAMMLFASCMATIMCHAHWLHRMISSTAIEVALATLTLLLGQTIPVSGIVSLSEGQSAAPIWCSMAQLSFPYYVLSAGLTTTVQTVSAHLGWQLALAVFPIMYGIHCSYRRYFCRIAETPRTEVRVRAAGAGV